LAKFQRLGPVWRKPRPNPWQKQKNLTRWANLRQEWYDEQQQDPATSVPIEIALEGAAGFYLITEQSNPSSLETTVYIQTEGV